MAEQDRYRHANGKTTSEAAFELHSKGTAYSAVFDHPGWVPIQNGPGVLRPCSHVETYSRVIEGRATHLRIRPPSTRLPVNSRLG